MAEDTPDTPETNDASAPEEVAPRRRAAPRKTAARKPKSIVPRAEETVSRAARAAKVAVVDAEERVVRAVKPRSTKRATPAKRGGNKQASVQEAPARRGNKSTGRRAANKSAVEKATDAVGGRWAAAAIASVAAGATAAAMLTLRGSTARKLGTSKKPIDITGSGDKGPGHGTKVASGTAHQPDGTDSSASFQAGIADENTVPDKI